jgi:hypothetical protein
MLLPSYKKKIKDTISEFFPFEEFDITSIEEVDTKKMDLKLCKGGQYILKHKLTPFKFIVAVSEENVDWFQYKRTLFNPKLSLSFKEPSYEDYIDFLNLSVKLREWLKDVKRYQEEFKLPDPWDEIFNNKFESRGTIEFNDEKFSSSEIKLLEQGIKEFKQQIVTLKIPKNEIDLIQAKLDLIGEKLYEETKFDWKSLFIGTISNIILTLSLPQEASGTLFKFVKSFFVNKLLTTNP